MTLHEKQQLLAKVQRAYDAVAIAYDYMRRHCPEDIIENNPDTLEQITCAMASLECFTENSINW